MKTSKQLVTGSGPLEELAKPSSRKRSLGDSSDDEDNVPLIQRKSFTKKARSTHLVSPKSPIKQQKEHQSLQQDVDQPPIANGNRSPTQSPKPTRRKRQLHIQSDSEDDSNDEKDNIGSPGDSLLSNPLITPSDQLDDLKMTDPVVTAHATSPSTTLNSVKSETIHYKAPIDQLKEAMDEICSTLDTKQDGEDDGEDDEGLTTKTASQLEQYNRFLTWYSKVAKQKTDSSRVALNLEQLGSITQAMEQTLSQQINLDLIQHYADLQQQQHDEDSDTTLSTPDRIILELLAILLNTLEVIAKLFDLLSSGHLEKKNICGNLSMTCLQIVKNQLDNIIYPLIDVNGYVDDIDDLTGNAHLLIKLSNTHPKAKRILSQFLPRMSRIIRRSYFLLQHEDTDDHVIVVLAFITLGPFFHDSTNHAKSQYTCPVITPITNTMDDLSPLSKSSTTKDNNDTTHHSSVVNTFEHLKLISLDLLQSLFSHFPQHRQWILDEILTSIGSLTTMDYRENRKYRILRNSTSNDNNNDDTGMIHIVSALFMQLTQCCCYNIKDDRQLHKTWVKKWELKYQKVENDFGKRNELDQSLANRAFNGWKKGIEHAIRNATYFLEFLMNKCKSRKKNGFSVTEYRTILECTIEDILTVLNDPDWPVAELVLNVFTKILVGFIDSDTGDLYLRTVAIEWLGVIASRIKVGWNRVTGGHGAYTPEWLYQLNKTIPVHVSKPDKITLQLIDRCRMKLYQSLLEESSDENTRQFYLTSWGYGYASTWKTIQERKDDSSNDDSGPGSVESTEMVSSLLSSCQRYWYLGLGLESSSSKLSRYDFPEMSRDDLQMITELLATRQTLFQNLDLFVSKILDCLDKKVVTFRIKAIRAIGEIAAHVPETLDELHIQQAVIQRINDVSPSVRDAVVELLARYLTSRHEVPTKLYGILSARAMDTAPNVRKRVVKLLPDLYDKCDDQDIKIDIGAKLLQRMDDNEAPIQKIALKAAQKVLFHSFHSIDQETDNSFGESFGNSSKARKQKVTDWTTLITSTVAKLNGSISGRNAILTGFIRKTLETSDDKLRRWYEKILQWIVDSLFEKMLALDENGNYQEFIYCIATIHAFTKAYPTLLNETQVYTLLPYLGSSGLNEWTIGQYVMLLYRDVLPRIKYQDLEFTYMVESALIQTLSRCPSHVIHDAVSCLCALVGNITHRYSILIKMLRSCMGSLRQDRHHATESKSLPKPVKTVKALLMCGYLCQYFDFDDKRSTEPEKMKDLDSINQGKITTSVFEILQYFTQDNLDDDGASRQVKLASLKALGSLYASHPMFMITPQSTDLLDTIFRLDDVEMKITLMHVLQDFLDTEETRIQKRAEASGDSLYNKVIDVETLLGNTEEFAELGANGSLMQRYLTSILKCALGSTNQLRLAAFDVIETVINQGLAHPMMCMPVIVAAETSPDVVLRNKAYYLHVYIHNKFGNILYSQMDVNLKSAYCYQKLLCGRNIKGYGKRGGDDTEDALLGITYSLLKEKKDARADFLLNLVKPFHIDLKSAQATPNDFVELEFLTFLADNLLTLPFSTSDEILCILHAMERILLTSGGDLLTLVQHLKKEGIVSILSYMDDDDEDNDDNDGTITEDQDSVVAAKTAIVLVILMRTRKALKDLYDIDDQ
ncbi:sister chromatid cohesion C-terminus-domain-containing protein [Chlamydoabsidia padenii]|nr:sister chromatid cohesion C-terminus-domain-containing protein [Chlamydoabsidia padenii]